MFVIKRKGHKEPIKVGKIQNRIEFLINEPYVLKNINSFELAQDVISGLYDNIPTSEIDSYTSNLAASKSIQHLQYGILAGRIAISNHHKNTLSSFVDKVNKLYFKKDKHGKSNPLVSDDFYKFVNKNKFAIDKYIDYERDYLIDFFGFKTLEKSYLLKINNKIIERPQDMFMRVAIYIHYDLRQIYKKDCLKKIFETYDLMSQKYMTHATPTLFNSGTPRPALLSCFLLGSGDSLEGIMKTLTDCAQISKNSGGIGFHLSMWRSEGSHIRGTNGTSNGIVPFLRQYNAAANAWNQGGKRPGSFAAYIEPHHPDIIKFLNLRRPGGEEKLRCMDLFLALWVSDLFMERMESNAIWSVFCPDKCPKLNTTYGDEYRKLYLEYEEKKLYEFQIPARTIWENVFESQKESGLPYILYKDTVNNMSMQKNIGTISSSNLCVSGDTFILTERGYYTIKEIVENSYLRHLKVWNGVGFFNVHFLKTGENEEMVEITINDGTVIKTTLYHNFIIKEFNHNSNTYKEKIIKAKDLKKNMCLINTYFPIIDGDIKFIDEETGYSYGYYFENNYLKENKSLNSNEMLYIPINYRLGDKLAWLAGFIDNKGVIDEYNCLFIETYDDILIQLKYLCQTLGLNPFIIKKNSRFKKYNKLEFSFQDSEKLWKFKLPLKRIDLKKNLNTNPSFEEQINIESINQKNNKKLKISKIKKLYKKENTYCFKESYNERGIFNGLLLGQCAEIVEYSDKDEYSVCCLASICLPQFVEDSYSEEEMKIDESYRRELNHEFPKHPIFNYKKLANVAGILVNNLNNIIERNYYPVIEAARSNFKHRPLGIGVQGLADVFYKFKSPFNSDMARDLNKKIFETIYYGALSKSTELCREYWKDAKLSIEKNGKFIHQIYNKSICQQFPLLAKEQGKGIVYKSLEELPKTIGAYSSYLQNEGSPISKGLFHWELFGLDKNELSGLWDWETLRSHIQTFGVKNSLLCALMPTASTSQIMGSSPSFEPHLSNLYKRKTQSGEFIIINKYLMNDLQESGLWSNKIINYLLATEGSVQHIEGLPENLKNLYKSVWEIKQKDIIDLASDRQAFVDQSQSMNLYIQDLTQNKFNAMQLYAWKKKIKTGCYYLYSTAALTPQKFTLELEFQEKILQKEEEIKRDLIETIKIDDAEMCLLCGS